MSKREAQEHGSKEERGLLSGVLRRLGVGKDSSRRRAQGPPRTGSGTGCPVCAGKVALPGKNDLASRYPQLAAQWHPSKNGPLEPESVLPGSHRYVWWVCGQGHEWRAQIKSRVSGCGCPV